MNELSTVQKIEQSKLAIREVKGLDEIKSIIDQSEALKAYAKSAQLSAEIQADIVELNLRATRRLGEISATLEKVKPGVKPSELRPGDGHNTKTAALADIGVSRQRANEAEKIASIPEDIFEDILKDSKADVSKSNIAEFARAFKKEKPEAPKPEPAEKATFRETLLYYPDVDYEFKDMFLGYLEGLKNDNQRREVCKNIIKLLKSLVNQLGSKKPR
jgi:hypothetical protein